MSEKENHSSQVAKQLRELDERYLAVKSAEELTRFRSEMLTQAQSFRTELSTQAREHRDRLDQNVKSGFAALAACTTVAAVFGWKSCSDIETKIDVATRSQIDRYIGEDKIKREFERSVAEKRASAELEYLHATALSARNRGRTEDGATQTSSGWLPSTGDVALVAQSIRNLAGIPTHEPSQALKAARALATLPSLSLPHRESLAAALVELLSKASPATRYGHGNFELALDAAGNLASQSLTQIVGRIVNEPDLPPGPRHAAFLAHARCAAPGAHIAKTAAQIAAHEQGAEKCETLSAAFTVSPEDLLSSVGYDTAEVADRFDIAKCTFLSSTASTTLLASERFADVSAKLLMDADAKIAAYPHASTQSGLLPPQVRILYEPSSVQGFRSISLTSRRTIAALARAVHLIPFDEGIVTRVIIPLQTLSIHLEIYSQILGVTGPNRPPIQRPGFRLPRQEGTSSTVAFIGKAVRSPAEGGSGSGSIPFTAKTLQLLTWYDGDDQ